MTNNEIIQILGGTSKIAKLCGVSPAAACQWRKKGIPKDRLVFIAATLEKLTNGEFSRKVEFPDTYNMIWTDLT
jgi:DNA-binding transcriptional regulator YdaS (Cro superfamily)